MPAEWEPHQATWLSYPHNPKSFFTALEGARDGFAAMAAVLARHEEVHINVNDALMERGLRRRLFRRKAGRNIYVHRFPTNDAWCRDHGCIVLKHERTGQRIATDWIFNAWGGKYPSAKDNRIAGKMAAFLGLERFVFPVVLEGGSIDVNGRGVLLTTERCLLNKNRNPSLHRRQVETLLKGNLGVRKVLWLRDGIAGDDTDGHIDDIARFTDPRTIVAVEEKDPKDANHAVCAENLERLRSFTDAEGRPFRVVTLPMPEPRYYRKDERLPASYANFYIANGVVLLPVFHCPQDKEAARILAPLFKGRKIVPVDASDIIVGLGTCHCLTQQIPV